MPTSTTVPADAAPGSVLPAVLVILAIMVPVAALLVLVIRLQLGQNAARRATPADHESAEQMNRVRRERRHR
jgi:hypothetical protein